MRTKTKNFLTLGIVVALIAAVTTIALVSRDDTNAPNASGSAEVWTCSMHPQVRLPKPGKCPICSMPLIRVVSIEREHSSHQGTNGTNAGSMFQLSDHARAMAGVETVPVTRRTMTKETRAVGKIQPNETALAVVVSRVDGYVERLYVNFTGLEVKQGDHLAEIYSPDLVLAEQELLLTLNAQSAPNTETAKSKLLRWGVTPAQVQELVEKRKVTERVTLFSPIAGTVLEKMVVEKSAVKAGDVLYRVANLESVWVYLDVYEHELTWVQYGQVVELKSEAYPNKTFTGRVWFISPVVTEETRTVKVLVNIANTGRKLKPGMFVSAVMRAQLLANGAAAPTGAEGQFTCPMHPQVLQKQGGACPICGMALTQIPARATTDVSSAQVLAVPITAVLDSGVRKLVYVERGTGTFAAVEVTLGPRAEDFYPVLTGLNEGDRVAVRGNFLLDSQFQISGLPSLFYREGQAGTVGHQHGGAVSAPKTTEPVRTTSPPVEHKH
jgi:membrane fusion protein, copper/silver efflux system